MTAPLPLWRVMATTSDVARPYAEFPLHWFCCASFATLFAFLRKHHQQLQLHLLRANPLALARDEASSSEGRAFFDRWRTWHAPEAISSAEELCAWTRANMLEQQDGYYFHITWQQTGCEVEEVRAAEDKDA